MISPALGWFLLGLVLVLLEFATPGVVLVFIGLGAWVASAAAALGLAESTTSQTAIFGVSSILLLITLRRFFKAWFLGDVSSAGQGELEEFLGKSVVIRSSLSSFTQGKVEFRGCQWNARTESGTLEPGDAAIISGRDGLCLIISAPSSVS
jgi:inner membrane protein